MNPYVAASLAKVEFPDDEKIDSEYQGKTCYVTSINIPESYHSIKIEGKELNGYTKKYAI